MSTATTLLHPDLSTSAGPRFLSTETEAGLWRSLSARLSRANKQISHLRDIPLFSECSDAQLRRIASLATELTVEAGRVLIEQDELGLEFFVIIEGWAGVARSGVQFGTRGPGSFVGEVALMDHGRRTATVVAETDMRVLVLSPREFDGLHHVAPCVAHKMLKEVASRLRQSDELVDLVSGAGVRVAF
jgi:CRP/FNR family cyclic AMP-dependent transcriptional regulator